MLVGLTHENHDSLHGSWLLRTSRNFVVPGIILNTEVDEYLETGRLIDRVVLLALSNLSGIERVCAAEEKYAITAK